MVRVECECGATLIGSKAYFDHKETECPLTIAPVEQILRQVTGRKIKHPMTPARGESMPQTQEYWEKRADMDQELILEQRDEINKLKQKINKLEQRNDKSV